MKLLIATDFDGTFCRGGKIDPADLAAVRAWRAAGRRFGFVTGRSYDFIKTAADLGLETDFLLLCNGAVLALPDGRIVKETLIGEKVFAALSAFFGAREDVVSCSAPDGRGGYPQYYAQCKSPAHALAAAEEARPIFGEQVNIFVNGEHVNIGMRGTGKAEGVLDALGYFGLPADSAAVFGDDYNDMDMIVRLGGWAVDTARPEVLAGAPHVCASVGEAAGELLKS